MLNNSSKNNNNYIHINVNNLYNDLEVLANELSKVEIWPIPGIIFIYFIHLYKKNV